MPNETAKYDVPSIDGAEAADQIDDVMLLLAERIDLLLGESGTDTITAAGAGVVTKRINYARNYSTALGGLGFTPRANVQLATNHADTVLWVESEDATGFTVGLRTAAAGTATRTFRWFCRGVK